VSPRAVLIGLPGTGKTTTGRCLAARLGVSFADSDQLVESRAGCSVPEIFETSGEPAFRRAEADAIAAALESFGGVLALGGGAILAESTRLALAASGAPVVLLRGRVPTLAGRVGPAADRPLLAGDAQARLAELGATREPLYRRVATLVVDTDEMTVDEAAVAIERLLAAAPR
jgi:shikimate kinase